MTENRTLNQAFRPRARLLQLLGDQLIGSSRLAVFELVKNAYDADADQVTVTLDGVSSQGGRIVVEDNGAGMSLELIETVWLVPGDDYRERQRAEQTRSLKYGRLPLGEKGVGRFAVHKLGNRISIVTRAAGAAECIVEIDWEELLENRFLDDAPVQVRERPAEVFTNQSTGTRIEITRLRGDTWTRGEVRDLYRQVMSISSPFGEENDHFDVRVVVSDHPEWIASIPSVRQFLDQAPYYFEFAFDGEQLRFRYEFRGVPGLRVEPREVVRAEPYFQVPRGEESDDLDPASDGRPRQRGRITANRAMLEGIGPLKGRFYVFDRDKKVLSRYGETRLIERYLDQHGGVRVYRDGMRVYNYGEPADDWLGLDLRRVNEPAKNLSRNITIGAIDLDLAASFALREKTNREGFVETEAFERLQRVVRGALFILEAERSLDKARIREATGQPSETPQGAAGPLANLRRLAKKHGVSEALEPAIRKIEHEYDRLQDSFLRAGLSQVGLAVVIHEVERGVTVLSRSLEADDVDLVSLREQAGQLQGVLETSTQLLRTSDRKPNSLTSVVRTARDLSLLRFRLHGIRLECPALEDDARDAEAVFAASLVLGALTNVIDNAVHWVKVRHAEPRDRRIFINVLPDHFEGPAIVVADNGPGLQDDPGVVVRPFFTRRPGGSGLGLYFANLVMELNNGHLTFPTAEQADVPEAYDGAVVALVFSER